MSKLTFSYTILKYVHDVVTGECLNVGVVVFAPSVGYAKTRIQHEYGRLSGVFEGFYGDYYRKLVRHIENRINILPDKWASELGFETLPNNAKAIANIVLPNDDSCLQFTEPKFGLTEDPEATLNYLYDRYVLKNQIHLNEETRSKEEVWKAFKAPLEKHKVLQKLKPIVIAGSSFEYEFQHAYKNAKWHPLEAISMDAVNGDTLKDRATRWVGRATDLYSDDKLGKLYLLIGPPQRDSLKSAYTKAVDLLHKMPADHEIITEDGAEDFAKSFGDLIQIHESEEQ